MSLSLSASPPQVSKQRRIFNEKESINSCLFNQLLNSLFSVRFHLIHTAFKYLCLFCSRPYQAKYLMRRNQFFSRLLYH